MDRLLETVNRMRPDHKQHFNGILVNQYNGGNDYVAAHSDRQHIEETEDVWSLSWGETRIFRIRDKKIDARQTRGDHVVHSIATAAANAAHDNPGLEFPQFGRFEINRHVQASHSFLHRRRLSCSLDARRRTRRPRSLVFGAFIFDGAGIPVNQSNRNLEAIP